MTQKATRWFQEALRLTPPERAELAMGLIEHLDEVADADAQEAWDAEFAQRISDLGWRDDNSRSVAGSQAPDPRSSGP